MDNAPLNPFKELRESNNITLELMAAKVQISKQALIRLEQGCYTDPLPTALQYYSSAFPVSEYELVTQYADYQTTKRNKAHRYFGDIGDYHSNVHPMRLLRKSINPTQVAKDLCIPPATLQYFERNVIQQKSVPKVILNVLFEIGYTDVEITCFMEAYHVYRSWLINHRRLQGKRVDYGYAKRA